MYGKRFSRKEVLERLKKTIEEGKPIIGAGASNGMIARCEEIGGADLIIAYYSCRLRMRGVGIAPPGFNPNAETLDLGEEVLTVVEKTPVIAGFDTTDVTWRIDKFLKKVVEVGFSGVIIFPSASLNSRPGTTRRKMYEHYGLGITRELEAVRAAQAMDLFTMAYLRSEEDAQKYAKAGVDCICIHCGGTVGGLRGVDLEVTKEWGGPITFPDLAEYVQRILKAAKTANPDMIALAHGGLLSGPEDTDYLYEHTDAIGFVGASSFERIPVERAVIEQTKAFKGKRLKRK